MHHLELEIDRHQISMMALEELVSKDSYARLVDLFVDSLPLEDLGFQHATYEKEGRPPYHPAALLKLYMYGYRHGIRSSTKLHQACLVNVEVWWLLKGLKPSPRTICYFRHNNAKAFKKAFQHFVLLLKEWKLIEGETIAIDSFKIRAQNSLKNNFNQKKIDRHIEYIENKVKEYQEQLDHEDDALARQAIKDKIEHQETKKENYQAIAKELNDIGEKQISKVDPDAKAVVLHRNIVNVGYNVQAGCDAKHKLFVNAQTGSVNDTHALASMAIEAKELLQKEHIKTLTDKGYTTGAELQKCKENNITTFSSPKEHSSPDNGLYPMKVFEYDPKADTYTCPARELLETNGNIYKKANHNVKHYKNRKACQNCQKRHLCTTNKNGRFIERGIHQEVLEANEERVLQNPKYYRLRQQITEHQFGTFKRQWGFTHTLMKGKSHVLSEVYLCMSVYNLLRSIKILGINEFKKRVKALGLIFWSKNASFLALLRLPKFLSTFSKLFISPNYLAIKALEIA